MKIRSLLFTFLLLSIAVVSGSCSKPLVGSESIDIGLTDNGLILPTTAQSCVDKSTPTSPPTRSLAENALYFTGFSITWKSTEADLYVAAIKVTVTSNRLTGGKFEFTMDPLEVEALIGATNGTIKKAVDANTPRTYSSTSTTKEHASDGSALAACGFGVGGLTLEDPSRTTTFTAQVRLDLIGIAQNPDNGDQQVVRQTITKTATYY
jgi:hypothetical protein